MKINFVDAFSLWSSHRFSSQSNGCLTLWYVNNGWCSVNGKTKTKEYCFVLISVLLWVRIKPVYLNDALCSKFVCTCVDVYVCMRVSVCVGQQSYCWAPRCQTARWLSFHFLVDEAPARWRDKEPVGETQRSCLGNAEAGRDDKTKQTWFSFSPFHRRQKSPDFTRI